MPLLAVCHLCQLTESSFRLTNNNSSNMPREDTEERLHDTAWDQKAIAASQPPHAVPNPP